MPELTLNPDQMAVLLDAVGPVAVKRPDGTLVGHLDVLPSAEWIAELKRRAAAPGPRFSGDHMQARLKALHAERDRIGPFDRAYMRAFLDKLSADDPATYGPTDGPR